VGSGCIDVWGYRATDGGGRRVVNDPSAALDALADSGHPVALAGAEAVAAGLAALQDLCAEAAYPLSGDLTRNHWLPTALGVGRPTCLAPVSFVAGDLHQPGELVLGELAGFRDFPAQMAAANLRRNGWPARAVALELPGLPARREVFSTDLARLMDQPAYRAELAGRWRPRLAGVERLGLPAIVGLRSPGEAWRDLCDRLGLPVFEIPTVPPSVRNAQVGGSSSGRVCTAGSKRDSCAVSC
jgi:glycerol-3-phosphate dehydrogenase subunit B